MAARQVFGRNPATGRVEHHYVDLGRMSASIGHSRPVVSTFVATTSAGGGQAFTVNGGGKQQRLDPMRDAA